MPLGTRFCVSAFMCATYRIVLAGVQVRSRTRARDNFLTGRYTRYRQEPASQWGELSRTDAMNPAERRADRRACNNLPGKQ